MPVARCPTCCRGLAGYFDSEKELSDLEANEIRTEISRYEARDARIRAYIADVKAGIVAPQIYPDGVACPGCQQGWREFQDHRKDLEQVTMGQAKSALGANSRWLNELRAIAIS